MADRGRDYRSRGYNRRSDQDMSENPEWDRGYDVGYSSRNRNYNQDWDRSYYNRGYYTDRDWDTYDYTDWNTPTYTYTEYWWYVPGPYSGIGPSGYRRSDERIEDDVNYRLTQNGRIDASNISVGVSNGEVTLDGTVNSRRDKRLAEDIADSVFGVTDVHNHLHVSHKQGRMMQRRQIPCGEIHDGMDVLGSDNQYVGTVKEIRDSDFLIDRSMARDVFVPFSACQSVDPKGIHLNVKTNEVDKQGWLMPEMAEMGGRKR